MKTLIIGFTPYHSLAAASLIESVGGEIYCAFTKVWPNTETPYRKIGGIQRNLQGSWLNIFMTCHFFLLLNWWRWTGQKFKALIPHPSHLFTNAVFFQPSSSRIICLYEDGLLNYHDARTTESIVNWKIRCLSRLFGFPYKQYTGHLCGCDERPYDCTYLSQPNLAVHQDRLGKIFPLKFVSPSYKPHQLKVLFLDQDTSAYLSEMQRVDCLQRLFELYPVDQCNYIYKPHHDYFSATGSNMSPLSKEDQIKPAEALLDIVQPSHVVSFYSSALMNIKNLRPDIHCLSIAAQHVTLYQDGVQRNLVDIFQKMKVDCLSQ